VARRLSEPGTPEAWIRHFFKVAQQRYTTCELLNKYKLYVDQLYLTGYVVECALKALILHDAPRKERKGILEKITRGAGCHDYENLKRIYELRRRTFPVEGAKILRHLTKKYKWSTALRYEVGKGDRIMASDFLEEAHTFLAWVERRL
jgi:hypothetical protein